jgi:predicted N-acetyltransferase YhbS
MNVDELHRIAEVDRSEHVTLAYEVDEGRLVQVEVDWHIANWSANPGDGHALSGQIEFCRSHLDQGGVMLGAFQGDHLVGTVVVRPRFKADMAQLAFLYIDREHRRQGIAGRLMEEACKIARDAEARRMYISAIPSASAVGFYLSRGCRLAEEVDPELFALEPEDIHLVLDL